MAQNYNCGINAQYGNITTPFGKFIDFTDKVGGVRQYIMYMFNRLQSMFEYKGLPDTIPQRNVELMLQTNGNVCVTEVDGKLYAFTGGLGGEPNEYYMPTIYTVANPYLKFSKNLKIDTDCIVIPNDALYIGLLPMFNRYASMLAENDATIRIADINARIINIISASDDRTKKSADEYINDIEKGKLGVIAEQAFIEGLRTQPYASSGSTNNITQLIELQQYLKASWFNDIGLNANYNMKREAINGIEAQLNNDSLLPLAQDMLNQRKVGWDKVNKMFGTNIEVEFNSSWKQREETQNATETVEQEITQEGGEEDVKTEEIIS